MDDRKEVFAITRDGLFKLVWAEPMIRVAKRFGVSGSYLARICNELSVPRPDRGYWAKLAVGKASPMPELPPAEPGDPTEWDRNAHPYQSLKRSITSASKSPPKRKGIRRSSGDQHEVIHGAKALFEGGRESHDVGYLKPNKRVLVDIVATKATLIDALKVANALFTTLENRGHRVRIAHECERFTRASVDHREKGKGYEGYKEVWSPWRITVVYIDDVPIGLTLFEMSETVRMRYVNGAYIRDEHYLPPKRGRVTDHSWTSDKQQPSGRFCLQAYAPQRRVNWLRQWPESRIGELQSRLMDIVTELENAPTELRQLIEAADHKQKLEEERWRAQQEEWDREKAERRSKEARNESRKALKKVLKEWRRKQGIHSFLTELEIAISNTPVNDQPFMRERLALMRTFIGEADPLALLREWKSPDEIEAAPREDDSGAAQQLLGMRPRNSEA
jgi:hypothetical protein